MLQQNKNLDNFSIYQLQTNETTRIYLSQIKLIQSNLPTHGKYIRDMRCFNI